jgi:hypothetical protein
MLQLNTLIKCLVRAAEKEAEAEKSNDQLVALLHELEKETEQEEARSAEISRLLASAEAKLGKIK